MYMMYEWHIYQYQTTYKQGGKVPNVHTSCSNPNSTNYEQTNRVACAVIAVTAALAYSVIRTHDLTPRGDVLIAIQAACVSCILFVLQPQEGRARN